MVPFPVVVAAAGVEEEEAAFLAFLVEEMVEEVVVLPVPLLGVLVVEEVIQEDQAKREEVQ